MRYYICAKSCTIALIFAFAPISTQANHKQANHKADLQPHYSIINIGIRNGFSQSLAYSLNDKGEVVGALGTGTSTRPDHVFLWTGRHQRDLGTIVSPYSPNEPYEITGVAINNKGSIVSSFSVFFQGAYMGTHQEACVWKHNKWQMLPVLPGFEDNDAVGINDAGRIALTADHTSSTTHMDAPPYDPPHIVLYKSGRLIDLGPGYASGINNSDAVCGYVNRDIHGYARNNFVNAQELTKVIALRIVAAKRTELGEGNATAINDLGLVAGVTGNSSNLMASLWGINQSKRLLGKITDSEQPTALNNNGQCVGGPWLWQRTARYNLNHLIPRHSGWKNLRAAAINNRGMIAGSGLFRGKMRAFLMTPRK